MVAYSFKAQFAPAIENGWKTQTIRSKRERHAHPGEMLQLYTGMRTAQCRKICEDVRCTGVQAIEITFDTEGEIEGILCDGFDVPDLDAFALQDGFADASDMADFWRRNNGQRRNTGFKGVLIDWAPPRADTWGAV